MQKLVLSALLIASLAVAEEEYVFKAKGEFAKELKTLMEKYAAEGKVEIQEGSSATGFRNSSTSVIDAFLNNEETPGDVAYGKSIYDKTCFRCHGQNAEKSSYANARALDALSKEELVEQLENYSRDASYGGSTNVIMHQYAAGLSTEDIASVSAYIYSLNPDAPASGETTSEPSGTPAPKTTTSQGTYLK